MRAAGIVIALLVSGCANGAMDLPPDRTSVNAANRPSLADLTPAEAAMTCGQIQDEHARNVTAIQQAFAHVEANRVRNQTATYIGGLSVVTLPALLATEGNYADKDAVRANYAKNDRLNLVAVAKGCSDGAG